MMSLRAIPIKRFVGTGHIALQNESIAFEFEACQLADGSLRAECRTTESVSGSALPQAIISAGALSQLEGTTHDGLDVRMSDLIWWTVQSTGGLLRWSSGYRTLVAETPNPAGATVAQFHLTNVDFPTDEQYKIQTGPAQTFGSTQLRLVLGPYEVILRHVPDSTEIRTAAQRERGVGVTAAAMVELKAGDDIETAQGVIDDLCVVLSLAQGNRVASVNCDLLDASGSSVQFVARYASPKRFGVFGPPDMLPHQVRFFRGFVQAAYQSLPAAKRDWAVDKAIDYYLDAKREGDEFEFWGLKMAVCVEFLCSQFAKAKGERLILPQGKFRSAVRSIRHQMEQTLCSLGGATPDEAKAMVLRTCEMNRRSLSDTLTDMNATVGARISPGAVRRFVRTRNNLVHAGEYSRDLGPAGDQYLFLEQYVWRFLIAALGHPLDAVWEGYTWESDGAAVVDTMRNSLL